MRAQTIIIGLIVLAFFVLGTTTMIGDLNAHYDTSLDTGDLQTVQKLNETYDFTIGMGKELETGTENIGQGENTASTVTRLWNSIKTIYGSIGLATESVDYVAKETKLNIPEWLVYGVLAIIILVIVIALIMLAVKVIGGIF